MPARSRRKIPACFYGIEQQSDWRDPRTGIRLAPGAIQNWPTHSELRWIKETRLELIAGSLYVDLKATGQSPTKKD
jgi:hypothetical protein